MSPPPPRGRPPVSHLRGNCPMHCKGKCCLGVGVLLLAGLFGFSRLVSAGKAEIPHEKSTKINHEWSLPNESWKMPFKEEQPITFVTRGTNAAGWDTLKGFWNEVEEKVIDPKTGTPIVRTAV